VRPGNQPQVLVVIGQARLQRPGPAKPLQPRRDLEVVQVRMVAAAGADELEGAGVAAFHPAVHDAGRPAPQEGRPAVPGPTGQRERRNTLGAGTQPWVTSIMRATRRGDGARRETAAGTVLDVKV